MKKNITFKVLSGILIASIIVIFMYIWKVGSVLDLQSESLKEMCTLFYNIACAYLVSYIFYIIQVYIPIKKQEKKILEVFSSSIYSLQYDMKFYIELVRLLIPVKEDEKVRISKLVYIKYNNYMQLTIKEIDSSNYFSDLYDFFKNKINEDFMSRPLIENCNLEFLEILTKIQNNAMFHRMEVICDAPSRFPGKYVNLEIDELETLYNQLREYCKHDIPEFNIQFSTKEEYDKYLEDTFNRAYPGLTMAKKLKD